MSRRLSLIPPMLVSALSLATVAWWVSRQDPPALPDGSRALLALLSVRGLALLGLSVIIVARYGGLSVYHRARLEGLRAWATP